ncbi:MAG: M48 family metallopeptidase [Oscillospiraceae bacterium]|nr:M48 family metallopeptidase [Oscillospiraceae bacterium]
MKAMVSFMITKTNYTLTRSKRRTIAIYVRNGIVDVRAPMRASKCEIDKFVQSKEKWISDRLAESRELQSKRDEFVQNNSAFIPQLKTEYIAKAKSYIPTRVMYFSKLMNVTPIAVKINSAKTRWGSCSGRKSLNFSWRLIMADDDVIDYVVVHELAHITEMNHSPRFWAIVENILPDYKTRQLKLKQLQKVLSVQDWD